MPESENGKAHNFAGIGIQPEEELIVLFNGDGFTGPISEHYFKDVVFQVIAKVIWSIVSKFSYRTERFSARTIALLRMTSLHRHH